MLREEKNLKDPTLLPPLIKGRVGEGSVSVMSYTKTQKLITALYMVTDIMDKDEPLRNKLRTLGIEILSDTNSDKKIQETMSFLDIASAMNFISEMNCAILKKEFLELKNSIQEQREIKPVWLEGFFDSPLEEYPDFSRGEVDIHPVSLKRATPQEGNKFLKGHTRIGVQKGSTLLKAIKDMSNKMPAPIVPPLRDRSGIFDVLKKQRRDNIINIIKDFSDGGTITDIKDKIKTAPEQASFLVSCSEKTLQRELVSMVRDGVLKKNGEKRWSRYFVKN
jgi:hypothetical protein